MKITKVPYPRPLLKSYISMAAYISFGVTFILIFFQPFGTDRFQHAYKNAILLGYGVTAFITLSIFYFLSLKVIHKKREDRWTIFSEVIDLLIVFFLSLVFCYIYSVEIFDRSYDWHNMSYFLVLAATVAILPTIGCLIYLFIMWKDVVRSSITVTGTSQRGKESIIITGNNKTDKVETKIDDVILASAHNNYVMLYTEIGENTQRHILRSTLKEIETQLDDRSFIKVHRSYIVNKSKIMSISGNKSKSFIKIEGYAKEIPLSRASYDIIKKLFN